MKFPNQPGVQRRAAVPHVCVCICTYRRPELLKRLLQSLKDQETGGTFTFSVVVADNDKSGSGRQTVAESAAEGAVTVTYCIEPRQNIALARNRALEAATGDYIAFIDDDEFPERQWLSLMLAACARYGSDGVLGPVK